MDYKGFGLKIFIRILIILLIGIGGISIALYTSYWMLCIWIGIIIVLLILELIKYIKKYYSEVLLFLTNLGSGEFQYVKNEHEKLLKDDLLKGTFYRLEKNMQKILLQKERNHLLLTMIVDAVKTAFVCFDEEGKIFLINKEAKNLFNDFNTNQIDKLFQFLPNNFRNEIKSLMAGKKLSCKVMLQNELMHLLIESNVFVLEGKKYRLLTFSDIKREMIEQEIGSYQKLTRIINHEIMNSAIPISNLTVLVKQMIEHKNAKELGEITEEELNDIKLSLNTIESRTNGLIGFIKAVKSFNAIKKASFQEVDIHSVIEEVLQLLKAEIKSQRIEIIFNNENGFKTHVDKNLIEQVFINILTNSIQALENINSPVIKINTKHPKIVTIEDNGPGILNEKINDVFVPFYTTKVDGSGIGLSVCRQIMSLHKGEINISSIPGKKTTVSLTF